MERAVRVLALAAAWAQAREPGARLHVFSVEAHLMSRADADRAPADIPPRGLTHRDRSHFTGAVGRPRLR